MRRMRSSVFAIIFFFVFSFYLSPNEYTAFAVEKASEKYPSTETISKEELKALKKQGIVDQNVTTKQLNQENQPSNDSIEMVTPDDEDLEAYGLTKSTHDQVITDEKPNSITKLLAKPYPGTDIMPKKGDILITSTGALNGLIGHAGIVISPKTYATIPGFKQQPIIYSIDSWFRMSANTKVIRVNDEELAEKAGGWADDYVQTHPNARYGITLSINSLDPTYCSKIVWQAYAKTGDAVGRAKFTIKAPYGFLKKKSYKTVTPKVIVSEGNKIGGLNF
ncbi:YiiX/YebB-like N1pC/P60 family cysteine hydrolase [Bacillus sp. NPDC077027]|uniref:YiiX/YebB-like N1pC/P60 family cysteine hydrolase n=1 Tax=Bacillus sp. NPDC077027 TaxID=3390548 RepID=UPI003D06B21B